MTQPHKKEKREETIPCPKKSLEQKKKKVIQDIRCLLNDFPGLHPLASNFFQISTLTVLKRIHLDLLKLDGNAKQREQKLREKLEKVEKITSAPIRAIKKYKPKKVQGQTELEIIMDY